MSDDFKEIAPKDPAETPAEAHIEKPDSDSSDGADKELFNKSNDKLRDVRKKNGADSSSSPSSALTAALGWVKKIPAVAKKVFNPASISGLALTLFVVTAAIAVLLAFVDNLTATAIADIQTESAAQAMKEVLPADRYDPVEGTGLFKAISGGQLIGFCSQVAPAGYGGPITMMVGVDLNGKVAGISIIKLSETPGLGTKAKTEPWFTGQFIGKDSSVKLGVDVDAISGSTITSSAVANGVREAVLNVMRYLNGDVEDGQ